MTTSAYSTVGPAPMLDARSAARALGGIVVGRDQVCCPGPGHSRNDRSLSVRLSPSAPDGFLVHSHAGDDFAACRDHIKAALGIVSDVRRREARPPDIVVDLAPDPEKMAAALRIWEQGCDIGGTLAQTYLERRAIVEDPETEALRWHPGIRAMLALFRNIATDEPQAISRTFLDHEARKIGRKFLGPTKGAAIKLDADDEVLGGLHIGEGVESCLAARMMDLRPCWALGSAGAIATFPVLNGVECLTILREPESPGATTECATRWHDAGREVSIVRSVMGSDLNDAVMAIGA